MNSLIVEGIKNIIGKISANIFHKKYDKLISTLTKIMNAEERTFWKLLVTYPIKYKELAYQNINSLNSSPWPKKVSEFYFIKNYTKNEKKLKNSYFYIKLQKMNSKS